jgi:hypothetical protein
VAGLVRDILGHGSDNLPDGAPRSALTYRNWRPALGDLQLPRLKAPLKLPYALSKGYEPGCWKPADIATRAEDRTFFGRLRNTGSAAGVIGAAS